MIAAYFIPAGLIFSSLLAIVWGYRMFCTGPTGAMRRFSGAVLAIAGVIVLVGFARHGNEARELTNRRTVAPESYRYMRQGRPGRIEQSHDRASVEKFI